MDSELGTVGKVDRTWWWVFGSQAFLAVVAPFCLVWSFYDKAEAIVVCLLLFVVGSGFSGLVGDLVLKWCRTKEWVFVPMVAVAAIVGVSLTWGVLYVWLWVGDR